MAAFGSQLLRFGYRFCAGSVTLGATGLLAIFLAGNVNWVNTCLSAVPWLFAFAAFRFAPAIRWSSWLYLTCRVVGACSPLFLLLAYRYYTTPAAQRPGWDGLSDILSAIVSVFLAALTALLGITASLGKRLENESANSRTG